LLLFDCTDKLAQYVKWLSSVFGQRLFVFVGSVQCESLMSVDLACYVSWIYENNKTGKWSYELANWDKSCIDMLLAVLHL